MMNLLLLILALLQSLNGLWLFKFIPSDTIPPITQWDTISVPSNWEIEGFKTPEYGSYVMPCHGIYRRIINIDSIAPTERVFIRFDGVLYAYDLYINDHHVGYWSSAFNAKQWDITHLVKAGANTITVDVSTRSHDNRYRFDLNDCWALCGIFRSVELQIVPATHISNVFFTSQLDSQGAWLTTTVMGSTQPDQSTMVHIRLLDAQKHVMYQTRLPYDSVLTHRFHLSHYHPWTAETPYLYTLSVSLSQHNKTTHQWEKQVGIRQITIAHDTLLVNGQPVTLRGVCINELHPDVGRAMTRELIQADLELMKAANINYIRTAHYPFQPLFHDLCDQYGIYVICEIPFGYGDSNLTKTAYLPALKQRAQATITQHMNHPSIILWTVGNENPYTPIVDSTLAYVKWLDPSRPRALPGMKQTNEFIRDSVSDNISVYTLHYQSLDKIQQMVNLHRKPIILTEYAHSLGLAFDALESQQQLIRSTPSVAGGSIWVWADQALLRSKTIQECLLDTLVKGVWVDSTHYYDSYEDKGTDGIVYANRIPQEDYYQVKKLYTPVAILDSTWVLHQGVNKLTCHIENRYDYLDLHGYKCQYVVYDWQRIIDKGSFALHQKPHSCATYPFSVKIPTSTAVRIVLRIIDTQQKVIDEHSVRISYPAPYCSTVASSTTMFNVSDQGDLIWLDAQSDTLLASPVLLRVGRKPSLNLVNLIQRRKLDSYWDPYMLQPTVQSVTKSKTTDTIQWIIQAQWNRLNSPQPEYYSGRVMIDQYPSGQLHIAYDVRSHHASGTILELGLSLRLPSSFTTFSWIGKGVYASTPHKSALNTYGYYQLHKDDLRFTGPRTELDMALWTDENAQHGIVIDDAPVLSVENVHGAIVVTDTRIQSSYGTKLSRPMLQVKAHQAKHLTGAFTVTNMQEHPHVQPAFMPMPVVQPYQPFLKSYEH